MAIFHLSVQIFKRSAGRSSVAAAAYRAGERLIDERRGTIHSYLHKFGIEHTEIMAPKGAPAWVFDRSRLWNEVERSENRSDAQVSREIRVALPIELSHRQQLTLLQRFIKTEFVARGMVADIAIHRDHPNNPHAHVQVTMRHLDAQGFGQKNRDWNRKEVLMAWREGWQYACNRALYRAGHQARVDHRSHVSRGLLAIPGVKIGLQNLFVEKDRRHFIAERLRKHDAIVRLNGEAIRHDPSVALKDITYHEATFTRASLGVWLHTRTADAAQFQACLNAVMAYPEVIEVGRNGRGDEVFTTRDMLESEKQMLYFAQALEQKSTRYQPSERTIQRLCDKLRLGDEQRRAIEHVVRNTGDLALIEGFAGTGKSYMFRGAARIWQKSGQRVLGMALSGKAAEGLSQGSQIKDCRSIAAWEYAWDQGKHTLQRGDVLVIDEAGMVGTRQMQRLLERAHQAGAKVVLAGDSEQLQAVEAGSPFRALAQMVGYVEMAGIRRQTQAWQRAASVQLARGETAAALAAYTKVQCVHAVATSHDVHARIAKAWETYERQYPRDSQIALTYRRADCEKLNQAIRDQRQQMGVLGPNHRVETHHGSRHIAVGERLCFTKNNAMLGVKNGTLATVESIAGVQVTVRLDGEGVRPVQFDVRTWNHFDWGYAVTVHRAQGMTVDRAHVMASRAFDRHVAYVAMTRHRQHLDVYYAHEEFAKTPGLAAILGRTRRKSLALDFMKAERVNAQLAERLSASPDAAVKSQALTTDAAHAYAAAARDYASAQKIAEGRPLTPEAAFNSLPETHAARTEIIRAAEVCTWWRTQISALKPAGWHLAWRTVKTPQAIHPNDSIPKSLDVGLRDAELVFEAATARLEALRATPHIWQQAKQLCVQHNANIEAAQQKLPRLNEAYVKAKADLQQASCERQDSNLLDPNRYVER